MLSTRDVGILPECEVLSRASDGIPCNLARDPKRFPIERVLETAEMASLVRPGDSKHIVARFSDADSGVRYWAVLGLQIRGETAAKAAIPALRKLLDDPSPAVKIAAAETLGLFGSDADLGDALRVLGEMAPADKNGAAVSILAMNAITTLGNKAQPLLATIRTLDPRDEKSPNRLREYPSRLVKTLSNDLAATPGSGRIPRRGTQ
jgi:uncharacterized sulfatase